ncbi:AraC family transcriptional regulator [Rhizobium sp. P38BS-XIX]|uniref:AraC family transcriptional regulator n=1 Tax=Rhizobium sp. P38BS-XIX TaxID=2726740 RepID=UPI0014568D70|nr:GyrI-like domain-containing protein [Rhizobium sp. P38BS-XIX]NLR98806.1 AraC family transcriptional regulator [Rhizobium sp. P38BS-XIX]
MKSATEQDYRRRIARVIEAIMVDPSAPHSVDSLAAIAHFSPYHFHRLYRAMTGESVAATIRRMRLAQAANQLAAGPTSVTEAALEAGYDSSQSFARAFRGLTGMTPTAFQMKQQAITADLPSVAIIERPPVRIFGLQHEGPAQTIPHSFRRLSQCLTDRGLVWHDLSRIGVGSGDPEEGEAFRYFAGVVLTDGCDAAEELDTYDLAGGLYARYRLMGPYALISPTFQTLFAGWLPQSGFEPDDRPVIEVYLNHPAKVMEHEIATDLLIPLRHGAV